ncbi:type II secretion system protein H [Aliidongia dinghuensis]|uniref:Type II secretion system protein H n=1 Tax=Aliidongia dinghuensis TaxID=1867774 RepID=A0A8J2YYG8_9PROT|nr:GspH/FimT family pseudopilin [Aliidongia dinghuensis]GGF36545.1 type II secretion system protein H [Aliidongia dinghuensis]
MTCGAVARTRAGAAGFTLIELLVCLALVATVFAMAAPVLSRLDGGARLRSAAHELADQMQRARARAIDEGRPAEFALDLATGAFEGGPGRTRHLPSGLRLAMLTVEGEQLGRAAGAIRFFPDGSSTGGGVALADGTRRLDVRVDWVTGRVTVESPQ